MPEDRMATYRLVAEYADEALRRAHFESEYITQIIENDQAKSKL